jgi:heme oxygenase
MQPSVLTRLKEATAEAHRQVEGAVGLFAPTERAGYERYLARLLGFYEPFEPALERGLGDLPELGLDARRKVPLLRRDLAWLGVDSRVPPRCDDLPCFSSRALALGGLYVIEGATLGGQVQLRRVAASLGVSRAGGAAFFGCYGEDAAARWQAARSVIAAGAREAGAAREILDGAVATFEAFERWLRTP